MEKQLILRRLQDTINQIGLLTENQFDYDNYITKFDSENNCGTVCCIAGYYPQWFPETNIIYGKTPIELLVPGISEYTLGVKTKKDINFDINSRLMEWHGLSEPVIGFLFYGEKLIFRSGILSSLIEKMPAIERELFIVNNYQTFTSSISIYTDKPSDNVTIKQVMIAFAFVYNLAENNLLEEILNLKS